ncbi:GNAT family N-acetyltransferase [Plantactinospora siamensis]|uniref:GNAT family N-acetyltransferase n=1 Tax=Plantactinospora siamensis TaxID=555372 RepID=A0ABV6P232_9ACTN
MIEIAEVDPHDDAALRAWHAASLAGGTAGRPAAVVETFPALARSLREPGPHLRRLPVAAVEAGTVLGALLLELPLTENRQVAQLGIAVPPEHRRRGVGAALWAAARAAADGRTVFQAEVAVPAGQTVATWPGALFARRLGFASRHVEDHLRLALPAAEDLLDRLAAAATGRAAGYRVVSWAGPCPEEHLPAYAAMRAAMSREVPVGELDRAAVEYDVHRLRAEEQRLAATYLSVVSLARTRDGEPAGYTLCYLDRKDRSNAKQDDTFVFARHRGHRLGVLLKVANLRQLGRHGAERRWLHSWTAESNAPMRAVNDRFGFRMVEQLHEYELAT